MLSVDVAFLPPGADASLDVAVVIDVLRMTTTATQLFSHGLARLGVVAGEEDARELARAHEALLLGERGGLPLPGFDFGNSPLEHAGSDLSGRSAVISTTNGSKAVEAAAAAEHVLLGAIVNAHSVATRALGLATRRVTLICSGTDGLVSFEDVLGAGIICERLLTAVPNLELTDAACVALQLVRAPDSSIRLARHAGTLEGLGFGADLGFAETPDSLEAVPERFDGAGGWFRISG